MSIFRYKIIYIYIYKYLKKKKYIYIIDIFYTKITSEIIMI